MEKKKYLEGPNCNIIYLEKSDILSVSLDGDNVDIFDWKKEGSL